RGLDFEVPLFDLEQQERALRLASDRARAHGITVVLGMEWISDAGRQIASVVIGADGQIQGVQTKNQLDPTEEPLYVHGHARRLFDINGVKFGVAICHEAFRYPETVRWAAVRGAKLVFHPHCTGSDRTGTQPARWGDPASPYYEKAMMCRALENGIFFASVNYAFRYQDSATSVIGPQGELLAHLPYGQEGVLVHEIDPDAATGLLARRYAPERYQESTAA
ncbi:MAG TPA: carbon-nitrogen hydrolase family protein, partial [Longimicrobium sp.]